MAKLVERQKAIAMRKDGFSLREISNALRISKGSASLWVRDVPLDKNARKRIAELGEKGRARSHARLKALRETRRRPEKRFQGHNKWKGDVSETAFIAQCVLRQIPTSIPVGDNTPYDVVVEVKGCLLKVQVKTITFNQHDANRVDCRRTSYYRGKYMPAKYKIGDFDILVGYSPERNKYLMMPFDSVPKSGNLIVHFDQPDKWTAFLDNWELLDGISPF